MSAVDWSTLTAGQVQTLVTSPSMSVQAGCELLNFDLTVNSDISDQLDASNGDVAWDGGQTIHRDCSITLSVQLAWGIALVRLYLILTDEITGLSARRNVGVFCLTAPETPAGETPVSYQVSGQDRLYLLNRQVGQGYAVTATTNVLTAIRAVFTAAGLTGVMIDGSASASTVPTDMVWPLVPTTDATATTTTDSAPSVPTDMGIAADGSGPTTWLQIVNDLAQLVNYRGVWADQDGIYQLGPYADPAARPSQFTFDCNDQARCSVAADRTYEEDVYDIPNKWIFVNSSLPDTTDGSGNTVPSAPVEGAGIYTVVNQSDGPSSIDARNGLVWPAQVTYQAADQAHLVALGNAKVATDKRATNTLTLSTAPFPQASHFDVLTVLDDMLDGGGSLVEAQSWRMPLDGGDVQWTLTGVG